MPSQPLRGQSFFLFLYFIQLYKRYIRNIMGPPIFCYWLKQFCYKLKYFFHSAETAVLHNNIIKKYNKIFKYKQKVIVLSLSVSTV